MTNTNVRKFAYFKLFPEEEPSKEKVKINGLRDFSIVRYEAAEHNVFWVHGFCFFFDENNGTLTERTSGARLIPRGSNFTLEQSLKLLRSKSWEELNEAIVPIQFAYRNPVLDVIINI